MPAAARPAEREAAQRVIQARAGYWPKVDLLESWQRGNQPVFVFSSLLAQRQFTAANFALDALNHPEALDNFRSAVTVEQPLFDRRHEGQRHRRPHRSRDGGGHSPDGGP